MADAFKIIETMMSGMNETEIKAVGKQAADLLNTKQNAYIYKFVHEEDPNNLFSKPAVKRKDYGRGKGYEMWVMRVRGIDWRRSRAPSLKTIVTDWGKIDQLSSYPAGSLVIVGRNNFDGSRELLVGRCVANGSVQLGATSGLFTEVKNQNQIVGIEALGWGKTNKQWHDLVKQTLVDDDDLVNTLKTLHPSKSFDGLRNSPTLGALWELSKHLTLSTGSSNNSSQVPTQDEQEGPPF